MKNNENIMPRSITESMCIKWRQYMEIVELAEDWIRVHRKKSIGKDTIIWSELGFWFSKIMRF